MLADIEVKIRHNYICPGNTSVGSMVLPFQQKISSYVDKQTAKV